MTTREQAIAQRTALTVPEVIGDARRRLTAGGRLYWLAVVTLGLLALAGVAAALYRAFAEGFGQLRPWAYAAVAFGFLLATVQAAPLVAITLRVTRAQWRRAMNRVCELPAAAGIVTLLVYIPAMLALPSSAGRHTIWTIWPWGAPWLWDTILVTLLVASGYALLYLSAIPDFAVAGAQLGGRRGRWLRRLARGWRGARGQWVTLERGVGLLGGLYAILYVGVMTLVATDFAMTLVPGWISAVFPPYMVVAAFEAGVAFVVALLAALRRWGGLGRYLDIDQFHALSKLQLTMALLWLYFWFSGFIILWYGRLPTEIDVMELIFFDTYRWLFFPIFALSFLLPLLVLMWNGARKSIFWPTLVALGMLLGALLDAVRVFSAGYNTPDPAGEALTTAPPALIPGTLDILILAGALAGAGCLTLLALRFVPLPSIWEMGSGVPLRVRRRFLETDVLLVGKPD